MEPQDTTISRDERLEVRLSPAEKKTLEDAAWRERISMGEYIRRRVFGGQDLTSIAA